MEDGSVMGDKANLNLTQAIIANGWTPPKPRGAFDVLSIVLEISTNDIRMFDVPQAYCRFVIPIDANAGRIGETRSVCFPLDCIIPSRQVQSLSGDYASSR